MACLFEHKGIGPNEVVRSIEAVGPGLACIRGADLTPKDPRQNLATRCDPPLSLGSRELLTAPRAHVLSTHDRYHSEFARSLSSSSFRKGRPGLPPLRHRPALHMYYSLDPAESTGS